MLALGFPVFELAEIHDSANRGLRQRSDFHQIKFCGFGPSNRICDRHDTELLAFHAYQAYLRRIDLAVDALCFVLGYWLFSKKVKKSAVPRRLAGADRIIGAMPSRIEDG